MERKLVGILLCFAAAIVSVGCGGSKATPPQSQPGADAGTSSNAEYVASDAKGIQTITVQSANIPDYLDLPAHIEPDPTSVVHVFAPAGGRIIELKVRPWDHVNKGETLASLESSDLARAVADYHKALADNLLKQKELARSQDLFEHHAIRNVKTSKHRLMRNRQRPRWSPHASRCRYSAWILIRLYPTSHPCPAIRRDPRRQRRNW